MKKVITILLTMLMNTSYSQQLIDVAELTIKVKANSEEELNYGFAEGDQIVFSFQEADGNELKEVEISEYPDVVKFMDYKTSKIENKKLNVLQNNVFRFRFKNSLLLKGRICKIKIQRIASKEETKIFNTNVKWVVKYDTTWNTFTKDFVIGYDTVYLQKTKKEIEKEETLEENVIDKSERVHSKGNSKGNKSSVFFSLPQDVLSDNETKKVISWAYWVGVGEESNKAWQQNSKNIKGLASGIASATLTPLGALAVGQIANLIIPTSGEVVQYGLVDEMGKNSFYTGQQYRGWDFGNGTAGYKKFNERVIKYGNYYVILLNENYIQSIDVNIKVSAILEHKIYKDVTYTEMQVNPRYEKRVVKEPVILERTFPTTFDYVCSGCKIVTGNKK
jgi:hypothetical protein